VVKDHIGRFALELGILAATDRSDMRRDASVDDYVVFARVLRDRKTAQDLEAMSEVELFGDVSQL
jgi:hypothetical protein